MTTRSDHRPYLTERLVNEYRENGFLTLNGICSLYEIRSWQEECRRLWDSVSIGDDNPRIRWRDRVDSGRVADRIDAVLEISSVFAKLSHDDRFVRAAADVLGGDPDVYTATLLSRWPGTTGNPLQQGYPDWSFVHDIPFDDVVNVLIPIDPFDAASGALEVIPGYQRHVVDGPPGAPLDESQVNTSRGAVLVLSPGDVALIHGLSLHRSGPNRTAKRRESLLVTYVRPGGDDR